MRRDWWWIARVWLGVAGCLATANARADDEGESQPPPAQAVRPANFVPAPAAALIPRARTSRMIVDPNVQPAGHTSEMPAASVGPQPGANPQSFPGAMPVGYPAVVPAGYPPYGYSIVMPAGYAAPMAGAPSMVVPAQATLPMPMQPAPVQVMPAQPTPVQGMPMQGVPMQGMPMQPMPVQVMPAQPMPMQAFPMQGMPMGPMPPMGEMPMGPMPGMPMGPMTGPVPGCAMPGQSVCEHCGGEGCGYCTFDDIFASCWKHVLPYSEGSCCTQRWFDIALEGVYLTRETTTERYIPFMSDGPFGPNGPIVLSTNDLSMNDNPEWNLRFTGAVQMWSGTNLEFTYFGLGSWSTAASVTSADNLYSVFSQFGTAPGPSFFIDGNGQTINVLAGFADTDAAQFASIEYSSEFDSFELNYRQRWVGPNCRVQGSWVVGPRYFYLHENFRFATLVDVPGQLPSNGNPGLQARQGSMDYRINTHNSLTGFQCGGDLWACIVPGLSVGVEGKAGTYGNHAKQNTRIVITSTPTTFNETDHTGELALMGEASAMVRYRLSQNWTLGVGYHFLYIDGVALAVDQFDTVPPAIVNPPLGTPSRVPTITTEGHVLYHGGTATIEYQW